MQHSKSLWDGGKTRALRDSPITRRVTTRKGLKLRRLAVPAVFAVVELRS